MLLFWFWSENSVENYKKDYKTIICNAKFNLNIPLEVLILDSYTELFHIQEHIYQVF